MLYCRGDRTIRRRTRSNLIKLLRLSSAPRSPKTRPFRTSSCHGLTQPSSSAISTSSSRSRQRLLRRIKRSKVRRARIPYTALYKETRICREASTLHRRRRRLRQNQLHLSSNSDCRQKWLARQRQKIQLKLSGDGRLRLRTELYVSSFEAMQAADKILSQS